MRGDSSGRRRSRRQQPWCWPLGFILLQLLPSAQAGALEPFQLKASVNQRYDSNTSLSASDEEHDWITETAAGVAFNKAYGRQLLSLSASARAVRYREYGQRDYTSYPYAGSFRWAVGDRVVGNVEFNHETVARNDSGGGTEDHDLRRADVRLRMTPRVWLQAASQRDQRTENTAAPEGDDTTDRQEAALVYLTPAGNRAEIAWARVSGQSTFVLDNADRVRSDYDAPETTFRLSWQATSQLAFRLNAGRREMNYDSGLREDRRYPFMSGELDFSPGGKLSFLLTASRSEGDYLLLPFMASTAVYSSTTRRSDKLAIATRWQLSSKLQAGMNLGWQRSRYQPGARGEALPEETTQGAGLSLSWLPRDVVRVSFNVGHSQRDSELAERRYTRTVTGLTVGLIF